MSTTGGYPVESIVKQILADLGGGDRETFAGSAISPQPYLPSNEEESKPPVLRSGERALPKPPSSGPAKPPAENPNERNGDTSSEKDAGVVHVECRVVTLTQLGERLAGSRRLIVPAGAVVTPSVRDVLRKKNIELKFQEVTASNGRSDGAEAPEATVPLIVAAQGKHLPESSLEPVRRHGPVEPRSGGCLIRLVDGIVATFRERKALAAILTEAVAAGLCLANRQPGVRAIGASEIREMMQAAKSVGANVLVLDPTSVGNYQIAVMLREFQRLGPVDCPDIFQGYLS